MSDTVAPALLMVEVVRKVVSSGGRAGNIQTDDDAGTATVRIEMDSSSPPIDVTINSKGEAAIKQTAPGEETKVKLVKRAENMDEKAYADLIYGAAMALKLGHH